MVLRKILELAPRSIAEIGCGGGEILVTLAERGYSGVGYDPSAVAREHARQRLRADGVEKFTISDEWPAAGSFDLVLLLEVLGYAPDPLALLRDCRSLLRPQGHFILSFVRPGSGYDQDVIGGQRFFDREEMRTLLGAAGFRDTQIENYGYPLANALVGAMNRVHRFRMRTERERIDVGETGLSHYSRWFKHIGLVSNRVTLKPFMIAQQFFANTELGNGYVARASIDP